jgi:septum formation topological specificity factor MinE
VIFFAIVKPMNLLAAGREVRREPEAKPPVIQQLRAEILDVLRTHPQADRTVIPRSDRGVFTARVAEVSGYMVYLV